MELPQPHPYGTEGKKAIRDFLSLYTHSSSIQQDPRPSQGGHLKTHDFLQPLEGVGNSSSNDEKVVEVTTIEKLPPSVEHLLPGGIGTYSISHISYLNQMGPKPEGNIFKAAQASSTDRNDENSNCSSYSGSGFTLWDENAVKKGGKTGKEIVGERSIVRDPVAGKMGQWASEHPLSSSNHRNSFSSISSSQPSTQKIQSFMEMIKSAKGNREGEDDYDNDFFIKKEGSSPKDELTVNVDGKSIDQKASTPRSKHSATEQRRRSKINDRFQMLRELIPHGDQKRDKASFLLEVIEYIQFLQEKVNKYEGSFQGWNHEIPKLMPWSNSHSHRPAENFVDPCRVINSGSVPAVMFTKLDESNVTISPSIPKSAQKKVESDFSTATTFRAMEQPHGLASKSVTHPTQLQQSIFTPVVIGSMVYQHLPRMASETENGPSHPQPQLRQSKSCKTECIITSDELKEQGLAIEGGTISIASVYSQGLLNTLTQTLQSSGLDLSQASISVQIDLGKKANTRPKENENLACTNQASPCSRVDHSSSEEFGQAPKRLKMSKHQV